jgi:hypothetical protein
VLAAAAESAASAAASSYPDAATAYQGYDYSTYEEEDHAAAGGEGALDADGSSSYAAEWAEMDPGQEGYEYVASDSDSEDLGASVDASFGGYLDPEGWVFTPDGEYAEYEYADDWKNHHKSGLAKYEDGTPLPEKLEGLSAEEKLKPLQRMQVGRAQWLCFGFQVAERTWGEGQVLHEGVAGVVPGYWAGTGWLVTCMEQIWQALGWEEKRVWGGTQAIAVLGGQLTCQAACTPTTAL